MLVNANTHFLSGLNEAFNESNKPIERNNTQSIKKVESLEEKNNAITLQKERITYGLVSLEIMSDMQYQAFERVTASMSPNEKIAVAQTLTRAGNLSASVEQMRKKEQETMQEQAIAEQNAKSAIGFLGVTQEGWKEIAKEFQENLNHLSGIYTKSYNKHLTSNYNDILRKNAEAKTQRILREFSHAIYSGQIDTIG